MAEETTITSINQMLREFHLEFFWSLTQNQYSLGIGLAECFFVTCLFSSGDPGLNPLQVDWVFSPYLVVRVFFIWVFNHIVVLVKFLVTIRNLSFVFKSWIYSDWYIFPLSQENRTWENRTWNGFYDSHFLSGYGFIDFEASSNFLLPPTIYPVSATSSAAVVGLLPGKLLN